MANALFDAGREGFGDGTINWISGDIRVMLVKSTYVFSAAHKFLLDMGVVDNGRSASLASKAIPAGVANAASTSLTATAAVASSALVLFQHTGADATARLIGFIDTPASGLPFTPAAAQNVPINWDTGVNKIFKL
jgi:hypothetical protein